jgi:LmbE family N-acetylglucosaminyl deacetylase
VTLPLPVRNLRMHPWRRWRWLVLAPHPDDETLGTGALIAHTARYGRFAGLVYLTDGAASHDRPDGRTGDLISARKREARLALSRLAGADGGVPYFLGWKDALPAQVGDSLFERTCRRLTALCVRLRVDVLATTGAQEPHRDHAAAAELARAVQAAIKRPLAIADYVVWGSPPSRTTHLCLATPPMLVGVRRRALAAHRSQLTGSHGPGFRLPKDQRDMPSRDLLYLRRP